MKKVFVLAAAALVAAVSGACSRSDADATITTEVRSKLESDRIVTNPAQIQVQTTKKVVTLSGPVESPTVAEQAVRLAKSTEGVRNVVNNLSVTPGSAAPGSTSASPPGSAEGAPAAPAPGSATTPSSRP